MSSEQINTLIQRELKERGFPDFPDQDEDYDGRMRLSGLPGEPRRSCLRPWSR